MIDFATLRQQAQRIGLDTVLTIAVVAIFLAGGAAFLPAPLGLICLKILMVAMGFVHAHLTGKLAFPKVDWEAEGQTAVKAVRIALYVVMIYGYSTGG